MGWGGMDERDFTRFKWGISYNATAPKCCLMSGTFAGLPVYTLYSLPANEPYLILRFWDFIEVLYFQQVLYDLFAQCCLNRYHNAWHNQNIIYSVVLCIFLSSKSLHKWWIFFIFEWWISLYYSIWTHLSPVDQVGDYMADHNFQQGRERKQLNGKRILIEYFFDNSWYLTVEHNHQWD